MGWHLVLAMSLALAPAGAHAGWGEIAQKGSTHPTIVVDGSDGRYREVTSETLQVVTRTRGQCKKRHRLVTAKVVVDGNPFHPSVNQANRSYSGSQGQSWRSHLWEMPYSDPLSKSKPVIENVEWKRASPVALCNQKLDATSGAAREEFLKKGTRFVYTQAYPAVFSLYCLNSGLGFSEDYALADTAISAEIVCRGLEGPRVRTKKAAAKGSGATPRAKRMEPEPQRVAPEPVRVAPEPWRVASVPVRVALEEDPPPPDEDDPEADAPSAPSELPDVAILGAVERGGALDVYVRSQGADSEACELGTFVTQGEATQEHRAAVGPLAKDESAVVQVPMATALAEADHVDLRLYCPADGHPTNNRLRLD